MLCGSDIQVVNTLKAPVIIHLASWVSTWGEGGQFHILAIQFLSVDFTSGAITIDVINKYIVYVQKQQRSGLQPPSNSATLWCLSRCSNGGTSKQKQVTSRKCSQQKWRWTVALGDVKKIGMPNLCVETKVSSFVLHWQTSGKHILFVNSHSAKFS